MKATSTKPKSAIDLHKYMSKANNKSRAGKIFSLEKLCPKASVQ